MTKAIVTLAFSLPDSCPTTDAKRAKRNLQTMQTPAITPLSQPPVYLPFMEEAKPPVMGLKPLTISEWIQIDKDFLPQLKRKEALLANHYEEVFGSLPQSQPAQQEILDLLCEHLLQHFPNLYQQQRNGIYNKQTNQRWHFQDFESNPLDLAARLVQEDLSLMMPGEQGYYLAAASVCFPQRWNLKEKLGLPMASIHQQVPRYDKKLSRPVNSVFERLKADYPGLRFNWSLLDSPELHLQADPHQSKLHPNITRYNAGEKLWLRVERQTIRRLPISQGVLFTIRTYRYPLSQIATIPGAAAGLLKAVQRLPLEMQKYKGLLTFKPALLDYLSRQAIVSEQVSA